MEQYFHMNKINIKLYFKKRKQRLSVFGISPKFDWYVIILLSVILLGCGIVYATWLYIRISNNSVFEGVEDQNPKIEIEQKRIEIQDAVDKLQKHTFDESALN
jgi:hypothetical protein